MNLFFRVHHLQREIVFVQDHARELLSFCIHDLDGFIFLRKLLHRFRNSLRQPLIRIAHGIGDVLDGARGAGRRQVRAQAASLPFDHVAIRASPRAVEKLFPVRRISQGLRRRLFLHAADVSDDLPDLFRCHAHALLRRSICRHRRSRHALIDRAVEVSVRASMFFPRAHQVRPASPAARAEPMAERAVRAKLELSEPRRLRISRKRVLLLRSCRRRRRAPEQQAAATQEQIPRHRPPERNAAARSFSLIVHRCRPFRSQPRCANRTCPKLYHLRGTAIPGCALFPIASLCPRFSLLSRSTATPGCAPLLIASPARSSRTFCGTQQSVCAGARHPCTRARVGHRAYPNGAVKSRSDTLLSMRTVKRKFTILPVPPAADAGEFSRGPYGARSRGGSASFLTLDCGILADRSAPRRKPSKERPEQHEIRFLAEANLAPRNGAKFSHAGGQRFPGAPLSRDAAPRLRRAPRATGSGIRSDREDSRTVGATPIQAQKLADNLTMLSGPGGNVVVLNGPDGKFVVDTFLSPAWPKLKE